MDRINETYFVSDTGYTQPVSAGAGEQVESLRAQTRQGTVSGTGSQRSNRSTTRGAAKTDNVDISVSAWLRYLRGETTPSSEDTGTDSSQSYSGMRRERNSPTEFLLWMCAEEDTSYLAEKLTARQATTENTSSQTDWTRRRISTLIYFSGFNSQRVAFSHYQPETARANTAYQTTSQSAANASRESLYYQPSI